jgi:hypothetical protein
VQLQEEVGVTQDEKDQDQAVLDFLRGLGSATADDEHDASAIPQLPGDDVDTFLRAMGYNRIEREKLRRGQPRPKNEEKYRATTVKRFEYWIAKRLTNRSAEEIAKLASAWVGLTNYDLELAQRWWTAGVDPSEPDQLANAFREGLQVQDLGEVVGERTIAEHLQAGNSVTWCLHALHWKRSA